MTQRVSPPLRPIASTLETINLRVLHDQGGMAERKKEGLRGKLRYIVFEGRVGRPGTEAHILDEVYLGNCAEIPVTLEVDRKRQGPRIQLGSL